MLLVRMPLLASYDSTPRLEFIHHFGDEDGYNSYLSYLNPITTDPSICSEFLYATARFKKVKKVPKSAYTITPDTITWIQLNYTNTPITWVEPGTPPIYTTSLVHTSNVPYQVFPSTVEGYNEYAASVSILPDAIVIPNNDQLPTFLKIACVINIDTMHEKIQYFNLPMALVSYGYPGSSTSTAARGLPESYGINTDVNSGSAFIGTNGDIPNNYYFVLLEPLPSGETTFGIDIRHPTNGVTNLLEILIQTNTSGIYTTVDTLNNVNTNNWDWAGGYMTRALTPNIPTRLVAKYKGHTGKYKYSVITEPSFIPAGIDGVAITTGDLTKGYPGSSTLQLSTFSKSTILLTLKTEYAPSTVQYGLGSTTLVTSTHSKNTILLTLKVESAPNSIQYGLGSQTFNPSSFSKITTILGKTII